MIGWSSGPIGLSQLRFMGAWVSKYIISSSSSGWYEPYFVPKSLFFLLMWFVPVPFLPSVYN